jgi:SAM-dependent methyltransferase
MPETVTANLFDYPKYYDLIYGTDWKAEYDFILDCFKLYTQRKVKRVFEPACGTGRLLIKLAQAGYAVAGNDLNSQAVDYCNARFARFGLRPAATVGDMADFTVAKPFDAGFNMINTFRHLLTEALARKHFECMARAIAPGGLYLLGLHLIPTRGSRVEDESWTARRGHLQVNSYMWSKELDLQKRRETLGMTFDVYTPTNHFRVEDEMIYRTYTAAQLKKLLASVPAWEVAAVHDFHYRVSIPVAIGPRTEDVVLVLRRR